MKSSKYVGVCKPPLRVGSLEDLKRQKDLPWVARIQIKNQMISLRFADERQAAIQYDMWSIKGGREPKNILSRVNRYEKENDIKET